MFVTVLCVSRICNSLADPFPSADCFVPMKKSHGCTVSTILGRLRGGLSLHMHDVSSYNRTSMQQLIQY